MLIHATKELFAWDALEDSPSLRTIRDALAAIPDGPLLDGLRRARGKGRDDFPVSALRGVLVLTILLRHVSFDACLAELTRNADLRRLIGIDGEQAVPRPWNFSRFPEVLGEEPHRSHLRAAFDAMARRLGLAVPDLGRDTAGDATGLNARAHAHPDKVAEEVAQGLPQPSGGKEEYTDAEGRVVKVVEWFGYKLHLLVDVKHEVTLAYQVSDAKAGDNEVLPGLVEQACANLPGGRIRRLAYDKAADDNGVHRVLHDAGIQPLTQNRALWKGDPERPLPGGRYPLHLVHDEAGTVFCYDRASDPPVRHQTACMGYEKGRDTIKYRCPARHEGWDCPSDARCNADKAYGLAVRIPCELDLRRFPPIPRATQQFERRYKGRTAAERVNARFKIYWGADDGNLRGARRFHAFVGAILVVHLSLATLLASAPRWEGRLGTMRLSPIAEALRATLPQDEAAAPTSAAAAADPEAVPVSV
ncbi:MAG: transposase [Armatimonadetes bacterium]|nr:transposase [Armatimonadota bacterium]